MEEVELISFDAEGTLVTHDFSAAIWHEAIPALYAQRTGLDLARAKESVFEAYDSVGEHRMEWYDIQYWFRRLDLGSADQVIRECAFRIRYYPEVMQVLRSLGKRYRLIVASCTPQEFLRLLLHEIEPHFVRVFSSVSDYRQLKDPDFYLSICEEMSVQPAQTVHVGDSWQLDFLNSREAGLRALYLDRAGSSDNESIVDLTQLQTILVR